MVQKVIFAQRGDIVLEVGRIHILVSSEVLIKASSFFKAMLCGSFDEAKKIRSTKEPLHLYYPEEDPHAMLTVSAILHGRYRKYRIQNIDHLEAIAILCDYWDCVSAVEAHTTPFIERCEGTLDGPGNYMRIAIIAKYLKQSRKYSEMMLACFCKYPDDKWGLYEDGSEEVVRLQHHIAPDLRFDWLLGVELSQPSCRLFIPTDQSRADANISGQRPQRSPSDYTRNC